MRECFHFTDVVQHFVVLEVLHVQGRQFGINGQQVRAAVQVADEVIRGLEAGIYGAFGPQYVVGIFGELVHIDHVGETAQAVQGVDGGAAFEAIFQGSEKDDADGEENKFVGHAFDGLQGFHEAVLAGRGNGKRHIKDPDGNGDQPHDTHQGKHTQGPDGTTELVRQMDNGPADLVQFTGHLPQSGIGEKLVDAVRHTSQRIENMGGIQLTVPASGKFNG